MYDNLNQFFRRFFLLCKYICIKYSVLVIALFLWLIGGITLGIVGALTAFFVQTLIKRLRKDSSLEESIENPFRKNSNNENLLTYDEPFEGALLVSALGVYCTGNAEFAGLQMQKRFSAYTADWASLCRIAAHSESLNGDLIVECLAATLLKTIEKDESYDTLLFLIFAFLSIVEYEWSIERGVKPSEYLADLLQNPIYLHKADNQEIEKAYLLLGIASDSTLDEIKSAHRSLVALYHPDTLTDLNEEQKKIAAEAFLRIQAAYENIIKTF